MRYDECYRTLFIDFHNPEFPEDGFSKFDAEKYFQTIRRVRPSEIMLWTNDHYGSCFYDTKVGHKHARLKGDYFGELTRLAHENGIRVCAYISIGWHNRNAEEHPEWRQLNAAGEPERVGNWKRVCMNSPHRDFSLAALREIVENYQPDSVWLDILQPPRLGCYCQFCQEKFEALFGSAIPTAPEAGSTDLKRIRQFCRIMRRDFIADARELIHSIKPDVTIIWNGGGNPYDTDAESDALVDKLSMERQDWSSRWMRNLGKPYEILIRRGCYHWSDWTLAPLDFQKVQAATILANGGMVNLGDQGVPDGSLQQGVYDQLAELFRFIEDLEPFIKGASGVPNIAILHSMKSNLMGEWTGPSSQLRGHGRQIDFLAELRGACRLLVESHRHFDIIPEDKLTQLSQYRLLILPDQIHLSETEADMIRAYVKNGGRVIATFRTGTYTAEGKAQPQSVLSDLFGVFLHGKRPYSIGYIEPDGKTAEGLPSMPLLVDPTLAMAGGLPADTFWGGMYARAESATRLAKLTDPRVERSETQWVSHGQADPALKTDYAAVSVNSYGSGQAMYIAFPAFRAYWLKHYSLLGKYLNNLISHICPNQAIDVTAEGPLDVVLNQRPGEYLLHLIATELEGVGLSSKPTGQRRPAYDVGVAISLSSVKRVLLPLNGNEEIPFQQKKGMVTFTIPEVNVHQLVVIEHQEEA